MCKLRITEIMSHHVGVRNQTEVILVLLTVEPSHYLFLLYLFNCVHVFVHVPWRSGDSGKEWVLSFYRMGPRD